MLRLTRPRLARALPPPLEAAEQASYVKWFRFQFPRDRILAIPNGAFLFGDAIQRARQMARLKEQGLENGVPDLFVPAWLFWPEMKRKIGGRLSEDQLSWHAYLRGLGHTVIVAPGADSAMRQTIAFVRERAA